MPRAADGFERHRKMTKENRQFFNSFTLGSSSVTTLALLLYLSPFVHSYTLRGPLPNLPKRSSLPIAADLTQVEGFGEYSDPTKYDGYPVVPPKRAALIFDRILKGLQSASENNPFVNDWSPVTRRGNSKDKLYFRCYFNAVSCYKKK